MDEPRTLAIDIGGTGIKAALLDYAGFLLAHGQEDKAEVLRDEARGIAERLGARPLLDRADATGVARVG